MRYWIGLGTNLGDRRAKLDEAVRALSALGTISQRSRVYASAPVGGPPQPPYLNAAVVIDAPLAPAEMLASTQGIERALGRDRGAEVRWGPRPIDLDLLLAGEQGELVVVLPGLELPHPRLAQRAFALAPLCDLSPQLMHPTAHRVLSALLRGAQDRAQLASVGDPL